MTIPTSSVELKVQLIRAFDDADLFSRDYQEVLHEFSRLTKPTSQRALVMDAFDAGGGSLGEYAFKIAVIVVPTITAAAVAYISGRMGRKVKIKFADVEVEATSIEQVEAALKLIEERRVRLTNNSET